MSLKLYNWLKSCSIIVTLMLISFVVTSCKKELTIEDFLKNVSEDEDFVRGFEGNGFNIKCAYIPPEAMALTEITNGFEDIDALDRETFIKVRDNFSNALTFRLVFEKSDSSDILLSLINTKEEYVYIVNHLTYNYRNNFYILSSDNDTIKTSNYIYQRSYGLSPNAVFLTSFPKSTLSTGSEFKLVYKDAVFGISEPVHFSYSKETLTKDLPAIKFAK